ncbi:hypothetical protein [Streptomyces sp. ISL-11]|uniref:hypothetical protein n=1 Tax=Streptomyces sp. ISL-11 TaxID=2819174 RepID=UPI001BE838F1|nr:hypothetical protein [Streptomyces sp. ISL-11]MBT2384552.1 hypothetical protein [Streptomyces sp. ISL-11]
MLTSIICTAVSAAGLGLAALTAYRKRFLAATRTAAYALVPLGLAMTGIIDWITDVVLKPTVWAGFGVLALSALLFMTSRVVERRRLAGRDAVAPADSAPSLPPGRTETAPRVTRKKSGGSGGDFSDIEEILKKHGI